jgi:glucosylceramidase
VRRTAALFVTLATTLALLPAAASASVSVARRPPSDVPQARVWVTTPDGTAKLADLGSVAFRRGGSAALTVTVDPSRSYQRMVGFGASITDSSARVLYRLDPATRDSAMRDLFSPSVGDGLAVLRQPMGASDFVEGDHYTYDDVPAGQTDYALEHFSVAHDQSQILPLLRRALSLNPALKVVATPWSPPAWMKTSQSLIGGRLIDDPLVYASYAHYFVKFLQAYARAGVPVYAVTMQNEPQNRNPSGYPGTDMPVRQQVALINALGPALRDAGLRTKILGYDHNWSEHPADVAGTPAGELPETEYPTDVLNSSAARWVAGTAYHCYSGDPSRQTDLHRQFPSKDIWFTECSGSHGAADPPAQVFGDTLKWHSRNLVLGVTRNWGETVVNWNLALDPAGGPHNGGCDTCSGVVTVGPGDTVTKNAEYYTLGHLARFVHPGARRIASTSFGTTGWNGEVMDAAFRNSDGTIALVVHNENDDPRTFAVAQGDWSFDYTLPGGALATFTWPDSRSLRSTGQLVTPQSAVAGVAAGTAANAVDDDATTTWSTGATQEAGQSLQVDLRRPTQVRRVVLDTGTAVGDFPRGWALFTSADGVHWGGAVARGDGTGQLTAVDVRRHGPRQFVRHLRVVLTGSAPVGWTVADMRVYG